MNFDHDLSSIDVSGVSGQTLTITGSGAIALPSGNDAARPTAAAGKLRWSTTSTMLEVAVDGSTWKSLQFYSAELAGLAGVSSTGIEVRTGSGTYATRSVATASSARITVSNGDGVSGNPTLDLATVSDSGSGNFKKVTVDSYGRVSGTQSVGSSDVTAALGYTPLNAAGDSMTAGYLTLFQDPTSAMHAATKQYVDQRAAGLDPKGSVRTATTADITISNPGTSTISGVTLSSGDRLLVKSQSTGSENGIYVFNGSSSALTRATDANTSALVTSGMFVFVTEGTLATTGWILATADPITLGTTSLSFVQFNGGTTYSAGTAISLAGGAISIDSASLLSGIHSLSSNGIIARTGSNTAASRTITGTTNQISVTNGDGVSGNPTIAIANNAVLPGTTALTLVTGTNAQESGSTDGMIRYNSDIVSGGRIRQRFNGAWSNVGTGDGTVTSVGLSTSTDALTIGSTPVTTSGTITIALNSEMQALKDTLVASSSGSTFGIPVQTAANTYAMRQVTNGTGISITNPKGIAGNITITNTGVTSVALTAPSEISVSGSPVTTTGTLALTWASQAANTLFAAPNGSSGTPTFRSLAYADLPIALFVENPSSPTSPTAGGANAIAIGSGSSAGAATSVAIGDGTATNSAGQKAFANGKFGTAGDAQVGLYILRNSTSNGTQTELFLNGSSTRVSMPNNSAFYVTVWVVGHRTDATGGNSAHKHEFLIIRDANAASTAIVGNVSTTVMAETNSVWDSTITADTTNGTFNVKVTGEAAKTIRWVAKVETVEVTN